MGTGILLEVTKIPNIDCGGERGAQQTDLKQLAHTLQIKLYFNKFVKLFTGMHFTILYK